MRARFKGVISIKMKAYSKNCNGDFIVAEDECVLCCLPEQEAPSLMESDDNSCYFKKQPENNKELEEAISAVSVSCCSAVKYCGSNKKIIRKILSEHYLNIYGVTQADWKDKLFGKYIRTKSWINKKI